MGVYIGLLRAVNLGAHNRVAMRDLCDLLAGLGMQDTRSLLQSGNVVFRSGIRTTEQLERVLEDGAEARLRLETEFFVRTANEWKAILSGNPFPKEAEAAPGFLQMMLLKDAPAPSEVSALRAAITGREIVRAAGRHAYIVYPDGVGRSRLTTALIERKLGTRCTLRNWNTVMKLAALSEQL